MRKTTFIQDENPLWLKGNLHCHSTTSDGALSPEVLAEGFAGKGYDFLAITDHDIYKSYDEISNDKILLIPGVEVTGAVTEDKNGHFCVLQKGKISDFEQGERFQVDTREKLLDFLENHHDNYLITLNHPYWSLLECEEVIDLPHLTALEIYNHATQMGTFVGESAHFWNTLLRKGKSMWGIAADDNHNKVKQIPGWPFDCVVSDVFGGWVCVKAKDRSREAIMEALESGSFYASTGPKITDFYVEGDTFHVSCSPCQRIVVSGDRGYFKRSLGFGVTEFTGRLNGKEKFIRVQCADEKGGVAYSNPIYID